MYVKAEFESLCNRIGNNLVELEDGGDADVLGAVGALDAAEDLDLALQEGFQNGRDIGEVDVETLGA